MLGAFRTAGECSDACGATAGCSYFVHGYGNDKCDGDGKCRCYWEYTASMTCPEGWENDHYNFFFRPDPADLATTIYVRTPNSAFSDTARSFGWGGQYSLCFDASRGLTACAWALPGHDGDPQLFDTYPMTENDNRRWFADYSGARQCYSTGSTTQRCFSNGYVEQESNPPLLAARARSAGQGIMSSHLAAGTR